MILSSRVILSVYHIILVCLILIAVFAVFSQILKFRLDLILYSRISSRLYIIWYISRILGYYFTYFTSCSSSIHGWATIEPPKIEPLTTEPLKFNLLMFSFVV